MQKILNNPPQVANGWHTAAFYLTDGVVDSNQERSGEVLTIISPPHIVAELILGHLLLHLQGRKYDLGWNHANPSMHAPFMPILPAVTGQYHYCCAPSQTTARCRM
jgi:hypothetical protein